jgi:ELWxxDGT repeat protein
MVGTNTFFGAVGATGQAQLWRTNGTTEGTVLVKELARLPNRLTAVGNTLFFILPGDFSTDAELWKSDGTSNGTVLVRTINPQSQEPLRAAGNLLFFVAAEVGASRFHLWRSDGTAAGTFPLTTINASEFAGTDPRELTAVGSTLYFAAADGANGRELWKSNGTVAGTELVADIYPGAVGSSPHSLTAMDGKLFYASIFALGSQIIFVGEQNGVRALWGSDGTEAGTVVLNAGINLIGNLFERTEQAGGRLFFRASEATSGTSTRWDLWQTDGTSAGTRRATDLSAGNVVGRLPGGLILAATDGTTGSEPWFLPLPATLASTNGLSGAPGSTFAFSGGGFPAGATVTISVTPPAPTANSLATTPPSIVAGQVAADANGAFSFGIQFAANAVAGSYTIMASSGELSQSTQVSISASAPLLTAPEDLPILTPTSQVLVFLPLVRR